MACLFAAGASTSAFAGPVFPDRYDATIRAAAETWLPGVPWKLWKAQLYQESRLRPDAVSPVGAAGLAQFMPGTWRDVCAAMRWAGVSPHDAEPAIHAGAFYMAKLRKSWSAPRPDEDRMKLAQASYNAGLGNLLRAQNKCGGRPLFAEIIACLPAVTGHHSKETRTYVERIWRWFAAM